MIKMPQEFHVVQCYSCQTFQVHQVKKTTKWACKMCGEKQSLKKVYGRGTGVECRQHVQRLNTLRADLDQQTERVPSLYDRTDPHDNENKQIYRGSQNFHDYDQAEEFSQQNKGTKWTMFVEENSSNTVNDDDDEGRFTTDAQTIKQAGKRKREKNPDLGQKLNNKRGKFTNFIDDDDPSDYQNSDMDRIAAEDSLLEKYENRSMFSGREIEYRYNLPDKFNTFQNEYARKEGSNYLVNNSSSFTERETTVTVCAENITNTSDHPSTSDRNKAHGDNRNKNSNTAVNSKWGMFAENDISSHDDETDSSQIPPDELYDSRPYLTFDPEEIENPNETVPVKLEEAYDNLYELNQEVSDTSLTKPDGKFKSCADKPLHNSSKWSGFLATENTANHSEAGTSNKCTGLNNYKKLTHSVDHQRDQGHNKSSKRTYHFGPDHNVKVAYDRQTGESPKDAEKENSLLSGKKSKREAIIGTECEDKFSVDNKKKTYTQGSVAKLKVGQEFNENSLSYKKGDRRGDVGNISKLDETENVAPVFTTGELDDADFEL
ncbi:uncharacterized protein LOC132731438 [Ruditapes philippinarum]|uniref:uncharacterized protein LOC132731438 n=1 Tax=Ruditapes philippinarum TaxID=129788 RepID=UPI00295BE181|nr:uncharacterized protein LOC132731438 [Ruditapes philippinarum]